MGCRNSKLPQNGPAQLLQAARRSTQHDLWADALCWGKAITQLRAFTPPGKPLISHCQTPVSAVGTGQTGTGAGWAESWACASIHCRMGRPGIHFQMGRQRSSTTLHWSRCKRKAPCPTESRCVSLRCQSYLAAGAGSSTFPATCRSCVRRIVLLPGSETGLSCACACTTKASGARQRLPTLARSWSELDAYLSRSRAMESCLLPCEWTASLKTSPHKTACTGDVLVSWERLLD